MSDEVERKNLQVDLQVHATLMKMKVGTMTMNDVVHKVLEQAKIPLEEL